MAYVFGATATQPASAPTLYAAEQRRRGLGQRDVLA